MCKFYNFVNLPHFIGKTKVKIREINEQNHMCVIKFGNFFPVNLCPLQD